MSIFKYITLMEKKVKIISKKVEEISNPVDKSSLLKDSKYIEKEKLKFSQKVKEIFQLIYEKVVLKPIRVIYLALIISGIISWVFILGLGIYLYSFFHNIPNFELMTFYDFQELAQKTVNEQIINNDSTYKWVSLEKVNRDLLYTIVMAEDGGYFEHSGVDFDALFNALGEDIKKRRLEFGASTISQQVVKKLFLSDVKTFTRKLKEIIITRKMENRFTKNQVLEIYLNIAEFGPDIFGVSAASIYYFAKTPANINAAEGAFMALMLPSPRKYHYSIFQNQYLSPRHLKKLKRILKDMAYKEFISPQQYRQYVNYSYFK